MAKKKALVKSTLNVKRSVKAAKTIKYSLTVALQGKAQLEYSDIEGSPELSMLHDALINSRKKYDQQIGCPSGTIGSLRFEVTVRGNGPKGWWDALEDYFYGACLSALNNVGQWQPVSTSSEALRIRAIFVASDKSVDYQSPLQQNRSTKSSSGKVTMQDGISSAARNKQIKEILESCPAKSYAELYENLSELYAGLKNGMAVRLTPLFNQELQSRPHETYADKQALCAWASEQLRMLGLCIKSVNGSPAILVASYSNNPEEKGRFRIHERGPAGHQPISQTSVELPELELMASPSRDEGFAAGKRKRS